MAAGPPTRASLVAFALLVVLAMADCGSPSPSAAPRPSTTTTQPAVTTTTTEAPPTTVTPSTTTTNANTAPPAATEQVRLSQAVDTFSRAHAVPFSVVAVDLTTGAATEHLADRQVLSASLYKLFVARELLRRIFDGTLSRDAPANDGAGNTVGGCLRLMIVISDNRCGVAGLNIVGYGAQDAALARAGFPGTRLASPQRTTARDVARFFEEARNGTLLPGPKGAAAAAELYELLNAQQVNDRLPTGLPVGVTLAHKTGDRIGWAHDAAIVHTGRGDVVIVVLSGPWAAPCCDADHPGPAEKVAFGAIAEIGRRIYDAATAT